MVSGQSTSSRTHEYIIAQGHNISRTNLQVQGHMNINQYFHLIYICNTYATPMLYTPAATKAELASPADHGGGASRQLCVQSIAATKLRALPAPSQRRRHQQAFPEDQTVKQWSHQQSAQSKKMPQPPGSKDKMQVKSMKMNSRSNEHFLWTLLYAIET